MREVIKPEPGQQWASNDPRSEGRQFVIVWVSEAEGMVLTKPVGDGRRSRIRLERFADSSQRGYRYVGRSK